MNTTTARSDSIFPTLYVNASKTNHAKKWRRRMLWIPAVLIAALLVPIVAFHGYVAWTLARPEPIPLQSNPKRALGLDYEDVRFPAVNYPSILEGWFIPAKDSKRTVIFSHGYGANREEYWVPMCDLTEAVHKQNYNVLLFDYGYVYNPDQPVTAGVIESRELLGAVEFAKSKGAEEIYVWGFSMGAGIALQAALGTKDLKGLILDSTFLLTADTLYHNLRQRVDLPRFPSLPLIKLFFPILNGVSLRQIPAQQVLSTEYDVPMYLMHGMLDDKAPYELAERIAKNQANQPRSGYWLVPEGHHELLFRYHKNEYLKRALQFLKNISLS